MIFAIFLLVIAYFLHPLKSNDEDIAHFLNVLFVFFGASSTYILHDSFNLDVVLAAALVGFLASFIPEIETKNTTFKNIPIAVYCGTFVGMTRISLESNYVFILIASLCTGLLLIGTKNAFQGIGGKLGTFAFGGVVLTFLFSYLIKLI